MKIIDEREELEKILNDSRENISRNVANPDANLDYLGSAPLIGIDFDNLKKECEKEARIMLLNAISFIIPTDMNEENTYLKNKLEVDIMSLSGMIYQLKSNEIVQKTLMEQINSGAAHPRMFEVFSEMSQTIGNLNKQLLQTTEAIKETYKNFKQDVKEKRTEAIGPSTNSMGMLTTGNGSIITRGTKELINSVKNAKNGQDIKDIEISENNLDDKN